MLTTVDFRESWLNCEGSMDAGAFVNRHRAVVDFGNAITSRIEVSPAINMTNRSKPYAMPPAIPNRNAHKCYDTNCQRSFKNSHKPGKTQHNAEARRNDMQYRVVGHQGLVLLEETQTSLLPGEHICHI